MRTKQNYLTLLLALTTCMMVQAKSTLFNKGKSDYTILISRDATPSEQTAATELQSYLYDISGARLRISNDLQTGGRSICIGYNALTAQLTGATEPKADDESFHYQSVGHQLVIYGGSKRGTLYGVYAFLEDELGVRWYTPEYTLVPKLKKWSFEKLMKSETPAIQYRFAQYNSVTENADWCAHNKNNSVWTASQNKYGGLEAYWNAHTSGQLMPAGAYFESHPEYFSMRDGKRIPNGQLCLSNPDVLKICIEKMKAAIAQHPGYWVYSMSQNDNILPCECERCKALEAQYGGHSGILLWFVNQVADAVGKVYPDKYIGTFAYQYTRHAPTNIRPHDNVVIRLCDIECCFAHPLATCPNNQSFMSDLKAWSEVAPRLFIWDYVVNFRQYLAPFPNFGVLADNIKTFRQYHAIGIQEEAQYQSNGGEFAEMKAWVLAKLLWSPELSTQALTTQFIRDYYGKAAPYIQQYYDECQKLADAKVNMTIYIGHDDKLYTEDFIRQANLSLQQARQAVNGDEEMVRRVDRVCAQMWYLCNARNHAEAKRDGTYQKLIDWLRTYHYRVNEWQTTDAFIGDSDK
jgi:hypothetical protein